MLNKLTLETVKLLREQTGYGLIQCKEALTQAMNNTTNFNQGNLLKEAKKYLDKDVDYIYNGIEITHEQVLKQHKELKQWLNKMPIDPHHYAKQMNAILYYVNQQRLKDLKQADIEPLLDTVFNIIPEKYQYKTMEQLVDELKKDFWDNIMKQVELPKELLGYLKEGLPPENQRPTNKSEVEPTLERGKGHKGYRRFIK